VSSTARWRAWLSEAGEREILSAACRNHPKEIGGVLIGVHAEGRPWVTLAVTVPPARAHATYYEIPAGARHQAVAAARRRDKRLGYLGDWHSHPIDVGPSDTDRKTMRDLASDSRSGCSRPVLLIARRRGEHYWLDAHQQTRRTLRPLKLIAAGPLLSDADPESSFRPRRTFP
jgi:proteasome lid subunit RPN8/RPN11